MVVAPHQYAEFSSKTRTALYRNGQYQVRTQPGAYRFAKFTIMDHASTRFQVQDRFLPFMYVCLCVDRVLHLVFMIACICFSNERTNAETVPVNII